MISGLKDIYSTATGIASTLGKNTFKDEAAYEIATAFKVQVRVMEDLVRTLTGKKGLLALVPSVGAPVATALRKVESAVDVSHPHCSYLTEMGCLPQRAQPTCWRVSGRTRESTADEYHRNSPSHSSIASKGLAKRYSNLVPQSSMLACKVPSKCTAQMRRDNVEGRLNPGGLTVKSGASIPLANVQRSMKLLSHLRVVEPG